MINSSITLKSMGLVLGAAAAVVWPAAQSALTLPPGALVLKAAGRQIVPAGHVRIPINVDGAECEIIIVEPGVPKLVHVNTNAD